MSKFLDYSAVREYMSKLGFSKEELDIYLKLLEMGALTKAEICRETKIPRTTMERKIKKLVEKSMISKSFDTGKGKYIAEHPKKIELLLRDKEIYLENKLNENRNLQGDISLAVSSIFNIIPNISRNIEATVKYYQGIKGFIDVCNRSLDQAKNEVLQISNCKEWRKVFTSSYSNKNYVPIRLKKGIGVRALVINNQKGQEFKDEGKKIKRETRFLSDEVNFNGTLLTYTGEVSIMLSSKPYTAILLRSEEIYKIFVSMFNDLWVNAKKN